MGGLGRNLGALSSHGRRPRDGRRRGPLAQTSEEGRALAQIARSAAGIVRCDDRELGLSDLRAKQSQPWIGIAGWLPVRPVKHGR